MADTTDAEIQREVKAMAGNFGGGFEQNGFAVSMNAGGDSTQFRTLASSQEFLQTYGWGSPLWSQRTETYQTAAAQDGVIGDMNEGSRWNNTVPTVYSPNQAADAQDLSYGVAQFQPGQNPSGELPPVNSPALGGESSTLSVAASPGARKIQLNSIAGLLAGDQITLGQGAAAEHATIFQVGTASPEVPLSQAASSGSRVVHVAPASTATGISGTAQAPAQFVQGETVTVGSGLTAQQDTIASIGTYDVATNPTTLVLPPGGSGTVAAPAGATNVEVASNANFLKGDTITIGSGAQAESRTITSVGGGGSGTTLAAAAASGDLQISVASASGLLAGDYVTIGQGSAQQVDRIATISGTTMTLYNPLKSGFASGDPVALQSIGVTFTPALSSSHNVGENAIDTGTGITLTKPLTQDHPVGDIFIHPGTGVTLTAPLTKTHLAGANTSISTSLSTAAASGATTIKVANVTNLAAGDQLTIGQAGYTETVTIQSVGTAGAAGTGVTISPALASPHYSGDPIIDTTNSSVTNASGGVSDIERETMIAAELVQCLPPGVADGEVAQTTSLSAAASAGATKVTVASASGLSVGDQLTLGTGTAAETDAITSISGTTVTLQNPLSNAHASGDGVWDTCTTAATGRTRELDPNTTIEVTGQTQPNALNWTSGTLNYQGGNLPTGNGQPWELIDFYLHGDTQTNSGGTATTPNQWLGHLSVTSAKAMTDYFDQNILNDPATRRAIAYEDQHNGTPAVFEDSLENSSNLNWVSNMVSSWQNDLGYDPTKLLPALAATGRDATSTPAFDFPQTDGQGATLGWRVRDDYGQMWNNLYLKNYVKTLDDWATANGLTARFQSYGDPIDEGQASANEGIAEGEHLEFGGSDETQQFKVAASGTYQDSTPHFLSDECCEANSQAWADPFGINGTGNGASPDQTENNAQSVYADESGGVTGIVYHGWPYTIGAAGSPALWPGNTYGGDTSYAAGNGPNQPQFADDRNNNINVARRATVLRQGQPAFDVAVYHEDFGLSGQGQDSLANGWNMGTATSGGVTTTPTSGKLIRSSSSLAQAGYLYGYVSPAFFNYPSAKFAVDPGAPDQGGGPNKVLFPGHGDYRSLVLYDQSVMPVDVAQKIASLAQDGLPVVIVGQVPNAVPNAAGGTLTGMQAADAEVQAAMQTVVAAPTTHVVADATAADSQSADQNAPAALASLGILPSTEMNTQPTATPVLGIRRHDPATGTDYYQLFNQSATQTVDPSVTLTGQGTPYLLNTWSGDVTPIANYSASGDHVTLSLRIGPANAVIVAISPTNLAQKGITPRVHATGTTANASQAGTDDVVYNDSGQPVARASTSGTYETTLSNGQAVSSNINVPTIANSSTVSNIGGVATLTNWQLSVDSWGPTPSGDPTQTEHTRIPATGTMPIAATGGTTSVPSFTGTPTADWIWNTTGGQTAIPAGNIFMRKTFTVADPAAISSAVLRVNGDDGDIVWVNGTQVSDSPSVNNGWETSAISNIKSLLVSGTNVIAIEGINDGGNATSVIAVAQLDSTRIVTDGTWKALAGTPPTPPDGWNTVSFDDSAWPAATVTGPFGIAPWNTTIQDPPPPGSLPSWTAITPQNIPGLDPADNLTNTAGIGTYTTTFNMPSNWSTSSGGVYLNVGAADDTVDIWVNGTQVTGVDENDRNQVDIGPYLQAGINSLKITVATPLRNAVAVAPATPATGQVANSSETIGSLQGGTKLTNVGLMGPVTLTPYGQSAPLAGKGNSDH